MPSPAPEENPPVNSRPAGPSHPAPKVALPTSGPVPLDGLVAYATAVLERLAENRDVRSDAEGRPIYRLRPAGMSAEGTWQVIEVDFSAIGMATDMPLIVQAFADATEIEWHFGPTPIAKTPRSATPKVAAEVLNMNVLLEGFRRFVLAESVLFPGVPTRDASQGRGPVGIDPRDCTCAECGGRLEVTGVDDATMSVACEHGHVSELEHDAFDTAFDYALEFLSRRGNFGES